MNMENVERVDAFDDMYPLSDAGRIALVLLLDVVEFKQRERCSEAVQHETISIRVKNLILNATGDD